MDGRARWRNPACAHARLTTSICANLARLHSVPTQALARTSKFENTYSPSQNAIWNWLPKLVRMWFTVCSSSTLVRRVSAIQRCFISHHDFSTRLSSAL